MSKPISSYFIWYLSVHFHGLTSGQWQLVQWVPACPDSSTTATNGWPHVGQGIGYAPGPSTRRKRAPHEHCIPASSFSIARPALTPSRCPPSSEQTSPPCWRQAAEPQRLQTVTLSSMFFFLCTTALTSLVPSVHHRPPQSLQVPLALWYYAVRHLRRNNWGRPRVMFLMRDAA